jgi:hypothetical protein
LGVGASASHESPPSVPPQISCQVRHPPAPAPAPTAPTAPALLTRAVCAAHLARKRRTRPPRLAGEGDFVGRDRRGRGPLPSRLACGRSRALRPAPRARRARHQPAVVLTKLPCEPPPLRPRPLHLFAPLLTLAPTFPPSLRSFVPVAKEVSKMAKGPTPINTKKNVHKRTKGFLRFQSDMFPRMAVSCSAAESSRTTMRQSFPAWTLCECGLPAHPTPLLLPVLIYTGAAKSARGPTRGPCCAGARGATERGQTTHSGMLPPPPVERSVRRAWHVSGALLHHAVASASHAPTPERRGHGAGAARSQSRRRRRRRDDSSTLARRVPSPPPSAHDTQPAAAPPGRPSPSSRRHERPSSTKRALVWRHPPHPSSSPPPPLCSNPGAAPAVSTTAPAAASRATSAW